MAYEENITYSGVSANAKVDLSAKQFYAVSMVNDTASVPTALSVDIATAAKAITGILYNNPVAGKQATVVTGGICKAAISASQVLTAGTTMLEVASGGTLVPAASGIVVAQAMETLASTAAVCIVAVRLLPSNALLA